MQPTTQKPRPILVIGATGKQGGAVVKHLLDSPFQLRALVRDPNDPAAQALKQTGINLVTGNLDDRASLETALRDVYGVFSMQTFTEADFGRETRQGILVADVAQAAGVQHFVYSSVASADQDTGIPHFDAKWQVEKHLHTTTLPFTILRPVFFMENWELSRGQIESGTLAQPLAPQKQLQQLSVDDLGAWVAHVFSQPQPYTGQTIELAGDALTMTQTATLFSKVLGKPVNYVQLPFDTFESFVGHEVSLMYRWLEDVGYQANLSQLRSAGPALTTLETWLHEHDWSH